MRHTTLRPSFLAAAFVALLALSGCAGTVADGSDDETAQGGADIRGEWRFDGGTNAGSDIAVGDFPVTMVFSNGNARVRTGCFSFDQPMTADLDVVTASFRSDDVRASCMGLEPDVEAAIKSIGDLSTAERDGDSLTLLGDELEFSFTLVPAATSDQVVGTWALTGVLLGDAVLPPMGAGPEITFGDDGTVSGSTGCADFSGSYALVSGKNVIEDLEYVDGVCTAEETQTMIDTNVREVLDNGFLIHPGEGSLNLVSSTTDSTLIYATQA